MLPPKVLNNGSWEQGKAELAETCEMKQWGESLILIVIALTQHSLGWLLTCEERKEP